MSVPFPLPHDEAMKFLDCDSAELQLIPIDIRGLRMFIVNEVPVSGIGGMEFHRIRKEILVLLSGTVRLLCEDLYGGKKDHFLSRDTAVSVPPFILHSYRSEQPASAMAILANTLFDSHDSRTHESAAVLIFVTAHCCWSIALFLPARMGIESRRLH